MKKFNYENLFDNDYNSIMDYLIHGYVREDGEDGMVNASLYENLYEDSSEGDPEEFEDELGPGDYYDRWVEQELRLGGWID